MKDVDDKYLSEFFGRYLEHTDLIPTLKADTFHFRLQGQKITASRWTMLNVQEEVRNKDNDDAMQFHENIIGQPLYLGATGANHAQRWKKKQFWLKHQRRILLDMFVRSKS